MCIVGPERPNNDSLEAILDNWKEQKKMYTSCFGGWVGGGGGGGGGGGELGQFGGGGEVELFGGKLPLCPPPDEILPRQS